MIVVRVPQRLVVLPWGVRGLVPDLPDGLAFAQAQSAKGGLVEVLLPKIDDAMIDDIAAQTGAVVNGRVGTEQEGRDLADALATPDPRFQTDVMPLRRALMLETDPDKARRLRDQHDVLAKSCIDDRFAPAKTEWLDAMRQGAEMLPAREKPPLIDAGDVKAIGLLFFSLGWRIALAVALSRYAPHAVAFALTTLHADSFNRSDRSLSGDTFSDGLGVWTNAVDGEKIVSNQAKANNAATLAVTYDSVMSAVARQRVSLTVRTAYQFVQPEARITSPGASQNAYYATGNVSLQLYVTASGADTLLASTGTAPGDGDVLACDANGTTISCLKNGSGTSAVDSSVSSGVAGMRMYDIGVGAAADDFLVETETATAAAVVFAGLV